MWCYLGEDRGQTSPGRNRHVVSTLYHIKGGLENLLQGMNYMLDNIGDINNVTRLVYNSCTIG